MRIASTLLFFLSFSLLADKVSQADIDDLQEQIDMLQKELQHQVGTLKSNQNQSRANTFNPGITVFGNLFGCMASEAYPGEAKPTGATAADSGHSHAHAHSICPNNFQLREVEFEFRATIDPWADGVVIVALEAPHSHGDDHGHTHGLTVDVEEAYFTLKKLPWFDTMPLGMKMKVGRFRSSFGRFNKIHMHDLPQSTYPVALKRFMGGHGFMQNGASFDFIIPTPGDNNVLSLNMEVLQPGGLPMQCANSHHCKIDPYPAGTAHVSLFLDVAEGHDLDVGVSTYLGQNDLAEQVGVDWVHSNNFMQVYGADLTYRFQPSGWHSFLLGTEFFMASQGNEADITLPWGMYAWVQFQLNATNYIGSRYGYSEAVKHGQNEVHAASLFYTLYTTEFLRLRFGYEHQFEHVARTWQHQDAFMVEFNFIFGSHPTEPYWVNL